MSERVRESLSNPSSVLSCAYYTGKGDYYDPWGYNLINPNYWSASWTPQTEYRSMTDVVTRNFTKLRRQGYVICNPMSQRKEITVDSSTNLSKRWGFIQTLSNPQWWSTDGVGPSSNRLIGKVPLLTEGQPKWAGSFLTTPELDVERCIDLAVTGMWAKADLSKTAALVTLAEGKESIQSVISIYKRLIKIGKALRRGNFRTISKELTAKKLAERWMEARYAIRPMIYDMKSTVEAYRTNASKTPMRQTYRSGDDASSTVSDNGVVGAITDYGSSTVNRTITRTISARSGVLAAIHSISSASIWGLDQPFEALWELVPFSFVVDWFLNVGKTIASWTPNPGVDALASWCVVLDTTVATNTIVSSTPGTYFYPPPSYLGPMYEYEFKLTGGSIWKTTVLKTRIVKPNRSIIPSWKVKLDAAKLLDLGIMAKQVWFGHR